MKGDVDVDELPAAPHPVEDWNRNLVGGGFLLGKVADLMGGSGTEGLGRVGIGDTLAGEGLLGWAEVVLVWLG